MGLQLLALLIHFIFCLRKMFPMWVGGWVGRPGLTGAANEPNEGHFLSVYFFFDLVRKAPRAVLGS